MTELSIENRSIFFIFSKLMLNQVTLLHESATHTV